MLRSIHGVRSDWELGAWYVALAVSLAGCGRVGVELIPGGFGPGADASDDPGRSDAGSCETSCENAHGTAECVSDQCLTTCSNGYADCDGNPQNGCEADVMSAVGTCGSCAQSCSNPNGALACSEGLCAPTCTPGFGDCDQQASNGCEADLGSASTCGSCDASCSNEHGTTSCASGACMPVCDAGFEDCDGDPSNGCEVNTGSDPTHCGSCTNACGANGQICVSGACQASPCAANRAECDGNLTETCETATDTSLNHCGFCGNTCKAANGTPQCSASACRVASCNAGYGNCDNAVTNGCEAQLATNVAHCGACNAACTNAHGTTSCAASACVPSCSTGYGDCDSSRANGCETSLDSVNNCGSCGRVCPANGGTATCNAGVCGTNCNLTGAWALKMVMAATWPSNANIQSGSGSFAFWLKLAGTHSGNTIGTTVTNCGSNVPPFSASAVNETFDFVYPNTLFDESGPRVPTASATATLGGPSPGSSYALPLTAMLMGFNMSDPINAAWPTTASGITTRIDHDGDGKAGITVDYPNNGGFTHPRTGGSLFDDRADTAYTASRLVFSLNGTLNSCTRSTGPATVKFVDVRILGCRKENGSDCSAGEADFLDRNCVNYRIGTASYTLVKVADAATCADVQSALP